MFKLNKVQKTKKGELLMPFTVNGGIAHCFDAKGNSVSRPLSDFEFVQEQDAGTTTIVNPIIENKEEVVEQKEEKKETEESDSTEQEEETTESETSGSSTEQSDSSSQEEESSGSGTIWDEVKNEDSYI